MRISRERRDRDAGIEMGLFTALSEPHPGCSLGSFPHFLPLPSVFQESRIQLQFQSSALVYLLFCLVFVSLTLSQPTRHVSPIFDLFGLLVFRDKHLCILDEGIDILSKGPSLRYLCSDTTHTHLYHIAVIALALSASFFVLSTKR
jgi:hypothetical protein